MAFTGWLFFVNLKNAISDIFMIKQTVALTFFPQYMLCCKTRDLDLIKFCNIADTSPFLFFFFISNFFLFMYFCFDVFFVYTAITWQYSWIFNCTIVIPAYRYPVECLAVVEQHKPGPCSSSLLSHQCHLSAPPSLVYVLKCLRFSPLR